MLYEVENNLEKLQRILILPARKFRFVKIDCETV